MERPGITASANPPPEARIALAARRTNELRGTTLGRVEIVGKLGSGGMADVWLGRIRSHGGFERLVAVKTVHAHLCADARSRELFLREATLAAMIRHANVVDVQDVGETDGVLFQVMTLVEGEDLASILDGAPARHPLAVGVVLSIVGDALLGLHAAHEVVDEEGRPREIVHRDVSPQNILVGLDGVARVSDFGIAKALFTGDDTTGSFRGKVSYFSPEQASQAPLDRRSDVFSMGIVLWEALTKQRLFRADSMIETLGRILRDPIPDPREVVPTLPAPIAEATMRALERDLDKRHPTAEAMAKDLTRAAREAGCLLPRAEVAAAIDGLVGARVRERRAELVSSPAPATPNEARALDGAPLEPIPSRRGWRLAAGFGVVTVILVAIGVALTHRGPAKRQDASAIEPPPLVAASSVATPVPPPQPPASDDAVEVARPVPKPASPKPRLSTAPARQPRETPPRKAPFDQNPFGSTP